MENGTNNWIATGLWHQVSQYTSPYPASHSGVHSWWYGQDETGNYDTGSANDGDLTSPPIHIPSSGHYLRFWYRYETETVSPKWDKRWVQISMDGGPFVDILQLYDDPMNWWLQSPAINLSPYAGHVIQIRFHFNTLDSNFNDYRGWYIDDFSISTTPPPSCNDPYELNNTYIQATAIAYEQTHSADICPGGDYDFYTFTGVEGDQVVADIDAKINGSLLDSYLFLLGSDGQTVLAESDDEITYQVQDSKLGYRLPYTGTFYLKMKAWDHPSVGDTNYFYDLRLITDTILPAATITSPLNNSYLALITNTIIVSATDSQSGIHRVEFLWHDGDWQNTDWIWLGADSDGRDGWSWNFDAEDLPEQTGGAFYIWAFDWIGNWTGAGVWNLGIDRTPPIATIGVEAMYGDAPFRDFHVRWNGSDNIAGIANYDVQYRDATSGTWTDLAVGTTGTYYHFVGQDGHTYYFRVRARDLAGNLGSYTDGTVSYTVQICSTPADAYELDDTYVNAQWITTDGITQTHNIHTEGDQDWIKLYAAVGITYTLATTNTGGHADTVLRLYDADGSTLIAVNDDYPGRNWASRIDWQPAANGVYYAMVNHWDQYAYGCTTQYDLSIVTNDVTSPTGSVVIDGDDAYATSVDVSLSLPAADTGTGVEKMMVANTSNFSSASWVPYVNTLSWALVSGDGAKTVYVKYSDRAANVSVIYSDDIILDTTPPQGSIVINGGTTYADNTVVTLALTANDALSGISQMQFSNDVSNWSSLESFAATKMWTLTTGDGTKTVYVRYRDNAGNISSYSDTIILDTTPPSSVVSALPAYHNVITFTVSWSGSDAISGLASYDVQYKDGLTGTWQGWLNGTTLTSAVFNGVNSHTYYFQSRARDTLGSVELYPGGNGDTYTTIDITAPTGNIQIDNGADYVSILSVALTLSAVDATSGVSQMQFSNTGTGFSSWELFVSTKIWTLASGDGIKTVYVRYRDAAGNISAVYTDTIVLDTTSPTGSIIVADGATVVTTTQIILSLNAVDINGVSEMRFSLNDLAWTAWEAFSTSKTWALPKIPGEYTISVQFRDVAGNESAIYSDSVIYEFPYHVYLPAVLKNKQ